MDNSKYETYKKIFIDNNGILRASQAIKLGVPEYVIYKMLDKGDLIRESRGFYRLKEANQISDYDLIQVSCLVPKGVICLISALYFYGLTTQIPSEVYVALESFMKKPRLKFPPIKVIYLSSNIFSLGIVEHVIDGVKVKMYNREKTIADCFKFRNKIGKEIAIEALKDYLHQPKSNINQIMEYSRAIHVDKTIRPYLESLS
jgi:predicted transcriptional regulator of viral defense system